jgi:hypothetical protein
MTKTIAAKTLLHSAYVPDTGRGEDAVVSSEIVEYEDGTTEPRLQAYKAPKMTFWLTQPSFQDHPDKKEFESLSRLDPYTVSYKNRDKEIFSLLNNGFSPNFLSPKQRRSVYQSPYVYGANLSIEARIGLLYKKNLEKANKIPQAPTTGFFDIEMSLLKSSYGKLPLMVFTAENKVFLACKKSFMVEPRNGVFVEITLEDIEKAAHEIIDPLVASIFDSHGDLDEMKSKLPFIYEFYAGETEVDMIRWIWSKMHETKVSFIGVWNIGFDIPQILKVLKEEGIPLHEIFAHPDMLKQGLGYANWREDPRDVQHFTQKWHWLSTTSHYQFVDSMSLYSYIRQVDGKETSYGLDDILKKFEIGGKLKIDVGEDLDGLQTEDWHRAMLSKYFTAYALYAMWDGMGLQILEWLNQDLTTMLQTCDATPCKFYPNQTINATTVLFEDWLKEGYVLGTGMDVRSDRDDELLTAGGAVLVPQNMHAKGIKLFKEWPNHHTHVYVWLNDIDFSAQYPQNALTMNISKQTKVATIFNIQGEHVTKKYSPTESVEMLCSYLITPNSNGIEMGVEFFNLPTFDEAKDLFIQHISN